MNHNPSPLPTRTVYCADAIEWLQSDDSVSACRDASLVTSLPDISEFPNYTLAQWKEWFIATAALVLSRTPDHGVAIFYQSDIKIDGTWVDKGYLCQKSAESTGHELLWHKIACRVKPGQVTFGRPAYSHVLCFSKKVRVEPGASTMDVLPELGEQVWERGMGLEACLLICNFIIERANTRTIVNPFSGHGSVLAAANATGLSAIGIERSPKRTQLAQELKLDFNLKRWIKPSENASHIL